MIGGVLILAGYLALIATCGWWGLGAAVGHIALLVALTKRRR